MTIRISSSVISSSPIRPKPSMVEMFYLTVVVAALLFQWGVSVTAMGGLTFMGVLTLLAVNILITVIAFFGSRWAIRRGFVVQKKAAKEANVTALENMVLKVGYMNVSRMDMVSLLRDKSCMVAGADGVAEELTLAVNEDGYYDLFAEDVPATQ